MSALKNAILGLRKVTSMGGSLSDESIKALRALKRNVQIIGVVVIVAVLSGVVITAYLSLAYVHKPDQIKEISGGIGLTLGAALVLLRQIWREWAQTSLLLIIIENADEAQINHLFDTIVDKL